MRVIQYHVEPDWADYGWGSDVRVLQFHSDGRELAAVIGGNGITRVGFYDCRRNRERKPLDLEEIEGAVFPVLSPDFGLVACTGNERQSDRGGLHAVLSPLPRGKRVDRYLGWWWGECLTAMRFSPDGRYLAVTGWDAHDGFPGEGVALWDIAAVRRARGPGGDGRHWVGRQAATLLPADDFLVSLAFSADGSVLAAGSANRGVFRWDVATGRPLPGLTWSEPVGRAFFDRLAFSPDGRQLAARVSRSGTKVVLFDTETGASRQVPPAEPGPFASPYLACEAFAFHPAGRLLATVSGTVVFWDVATGTRQQELTWDGISAHSIAFSPDGRTCAAGGDGGRVVLWDVEG